MANETNPGKRPYHKPQLSFVKFVVEEATFAGCKVANTAGGPGVLGNNICSGTGWGGWQCSTPGT